MALEFVILKHDLHRAVDISSISMTADLKLMSFMSEQKEVFISALKLDESETLHLTSVTSLLWQEDIAENGCYKLLCIGADRDLICYSIRLQALQENSTGGLSIFSAEKWSPNFQNFLGMMKKNENPFPTKLLAFNSKEAVITYNDKFVITLFLSSDNDPHIISFLNVSEDGLITRQISLVKEAIFVLNHMGTKLSAYSVFNNAKVFEIDVIRGHNSSSPKSVLRFVVSLEKDLVVFSTDQSDLYFIKIEQDWDVFGNLSFENMSSTNTITAFAKEFPSAQRLTDCNRRHSISAAAGVLQLIDLSCDTTGLNLEHFVLYNGKLCFLFGDDRKSVVGVRKLVGETSTTYEKLENKAHFITGSSETFPLLLLYNETLFLLLYDIKHDKLVNEMMIFQCSAAAQLLSDLNHWQNIQMDVEALRHGLRHRQLHAVEFFLKAYQEQLKHVLSKKNVKEVLEEMKSELTLWDSITSLLLEAIQTANFDRSSCHFAKQLIEVTTSLAVQFLDDIHESMASEKDKALLSMKNEALNRFSNCLKEIREMLEANPDTTHSDSGSEHDFAGNFSTDVLNVWEKWKSLSWQEITEDALLNGEIAMAQSYFLNHEDICLTQYSDLQSFFEIGDELVLSYLKEEKLENATKILLNMGICANDVLICIFKNTFEQNVRKLLHAELKKKCLLSEEEENAHNFVTLLEKFYPCTSFEHAKSILIKKNSHLEVYPKCAFLETEESSPLVIEEINTNEICRNDCETGAYCRLAIDWVLQWGEEEKQRILVPHLLKGLDIEGFKVSPGAVWNYLLEHGDTPLVLKWISNWLGNFSGLSSQEFPFDWPLDRDMINRINKKAPIHVVESALNELAKHGVFCDEELNNFSLFLSRVGKAQCDLDNSEIFSSKKSSISFPDLCHKIVHHCLENNLVPFLFQFVMKHNNRFESWPSCEFCDTSLFRMTRAFSMWSKDNNDESIAYLAMVTSAEHIYNVSHITPTTLLQEVPSPTNIAMLLMDSKPLKETISEFVSSGVDIDSFKKSVRSYPVLYKTLFDTEDEVFTDPTVYQLLQKNSPFDVSRLFGWQSTNTLKNEDTLSELPHFLLNSLSEQHGLKETLTHMYYLMEGRPNYAYLKFVGDEVLAGKQITLTRVRSVCQQVFHYALMNFKTEKIASACVVFFELLGQDSLPLRVTLSNAIFLFKQQIQNQKVGCTEEQIFQEITTLFKNAQEDQEAAIQVINFLEAEVFQIYNNLSEKSLFHGIALWMPVVALAHLYEVNVGEIYLHDCAKNDDWFGFLTFAQIFQIPKEQVMKASGKFSNSCIGNHLCKSLEKSPKSDDFGSQRRERLNKEKDLRKSYIYRIGVEKNIQQSLEVPARSELDEETFSGVSIDTASSIEQELNAETIYENLFMQLLYSHKTAIPWVTLLSTSYLLHNPTLSLLAASYPDSDYLCCFTTWLFATLQHKTTPKSFSERKNIVSSWTEADLEKFILCAVKENKFLVLRQGVFLFIPKTPILPFMDFMVSFFKYKKFDSSVESLKSYQKGLWDYPQNDDLQSPLHSLRWIETISIAILKEVLINCQNSYERLLFLRHLYFAGLDSTFTQQVSSIRFNKLYDMVQYCNDSGENCDIDSFLLPRSHAKYKTACWSVITKLHEQHKYNNAKLFARVAGLPSEDVLIHQFEFKAKEIKQSPDWHNLSTRITFWKSIMKTMNDNNLNTRLINQFFQMQLDLSLQYGEKCFLQQLIIQCHLKDKEVNLVEIAQLIGNMWLCCVKEVKQKLSLEDLDILMKTQKCVAINVDDACVENLTDAKDIEALENVINFLLKKRDVDQAFQISNLFHHHYRELKVIEICLQLSNETLQPEKINLEEFKGQTDSSQTSRRLSLVPWVSDPDADFNPAHLKIIEVLEKLCNEAKIATQICNTILLTFTAASVLNMTFEELNKNYDPFYILKNVLTSKYSEKFSLAKNLIMVYELNDDQTSTFLSQEIHTSLQLLPQSCVMLPENELVTSEVGQIMYNPTDVSMCFQLIVKLCTDTSLIGKKLMNIITLIAVDAENLKSNSQRLYEIVELCICAHECFTVACNVEGIAQVLYKSRLLISTLEEAKQFTLIVRLLTGIGRYSEMSYVFDVLHQHREFEMLLNKKMKKVPNLRSLTLALLDYLKRCPSSDVEEYYSMLRLNFSMHREIAEQLEMSARKLLNQLSKRTTDMDLNKELKMAMDDLADAAKSYCKDDCLSQAQLCAQLAKLVALQIFLLPSGTWIINLDNMAVSRCITEMADFSKALIIAEAYNYPHCWSQALYYNVIVQDNWDYFKDVQCCLGISESMTEDIVRSFQYSPNKTENQTKNMKKFLTFCSDIETRYKFVCQLGFDDMKEDMTQGENGPFLKDLMTIRKIPL